MKRISCILIISEEAYKTYFSFTGATLFPPRGRLWHGRHFTYKSFAGDLAITLVCPGVQGTFADHDHPFAARGPWLQVFVSEPLATQLLVDLEPLLSTHMVSGSPCSHLVLAVICA